MEPESTLPEVAIVKDVLTKKGKGKKRTPRAERPRPAKTLPTTRIVLEKQLDILRAYGAASSDGTKAVMVKDVAGIVSMADTTVSLTNAFFVSVGFVQRTDNGFVPSPEVIAFLRAYQWNKETASYKLAPVVQKAWFGMALLPKLQFGALTENDAITCLDEEAKAGPDHRKELSILIDYLQAAGLVQREGGHVKAVSNGSGPSIQSRVLEPSQEIIAPEPPSKARVLTAFSREAEGAVNFNVSVRVNMQEFAGWNADRINAFFAGIAKVLAAKAGIEEDAGR